MKDLRKTNNVDAKKNNFSIRPINWVRSNYKNMLIVLLMFILMNIIFNPSGVARIISNWISIFLNNWNV